jgi:hypothetical protein
MTPFTSYPLSQLKPKDKKDHKFVAYYSYDHDLETFETFEEAEKWLQARYDNDGTDDGIPEETSLGLDFIGIIESTPDACCQAIQEGEALTPHILITHRSKYTVTDSKEDYDNAEEDWPYSESFDVVGVVTLEPVTSLPYMSLITAASDNQ